MEATTKSFIGGGGETEDTSSSLPKAKEISIKITPD